jgi:hypothetical protein
LGIIPISGDPIMADETDDPASAKPVNPSEVQTVRVIDRHTIDPHNVTPVFVDWCWYHNLAHGVVRMTLVAAQDTPLTDGSGGTAPDAVVVARLRFSIPTAVELRDKLNQAILAAAPTGEAKPN